MSARLSAIKKLFTSPAIDRMLSKFSNNRDFDSFFVKLLPSNLQYTTSAKRLTSVNGINYELYLRQWMEYVLYFGIKTENKQPLYQLVKPGMIVFDIGANFGETLLNIASITGRAGKVYGFEPMPYIYNKCLKNINLNKFENIILENKALGDKAELLQLNEPDNSNSGGTYVTKIVGNNRRGLTIESITLDQYVQQKGIQLIDLLKVDVEGFETNVIKGGISSIEKFKPILFLEFSDENLKRTGSSAVDLIQLLHQLDYSVHDVNGNKITTENTSVFKHTDVIARPNG